MHLSLEGLDSLQVHKRLRFLFVFLVLFCSRWGREVVVGIWFNLVLPCSVWRARILLLFMGSGGPPQGEWKSLRFSPHRLQTLYTLLWIKEGAGHGRRKKPRLYYITKFFCLSLRCEQRRTASRKQSMGTEMEPGKAMVLDVAKEMVPGSLVHQAQG